MTQPRIDWDRDVSLPVSGRTTHIRHASATGAATASKTRDRLSVAYRDSAERGVHRKNPATHKMNEL